MSTPAGEWPGGSLRPGPEQPGLAAMVGMGDGDQGLGSLGERPSGRQDVTPKPRASFMT
jgi:hypothetical protein